MFSVTFPAPFTIMHTFTMQIKLEVDLNLAVFAFAASNDTLMKYGNNFFNL